jgi:hypothetical protein
LKFATTLTHLPHPPHRSLFWYPFSNLNVDPNLNLLRLFRFERARDQIEGILVKDKGEEGNVVKSKKQIETRVPF